MQKMTEAEFLKLSKEKPIRAIYEENLLNGIGVPVPGIGYLFPLTRSARKSRNPRTGEVIDVPEKKTVKIVVSKRIKDKLK